MSALPAAAFPPPLPAAALAGALDRIKAALGPKGWTDDPDRTGPYLAEQRGRFKGRSPLVVMPAATEEVAKVVAICAEVGLPIVPQGGNTGLVGGSIPFEEGREILMSLKRMNRVREVDPGNHAMTCEAGVTILEAQQAAERADRLFPLSYGSEGTATVGGGVSANSGGIAVLRYGNMRDLVLGLEAVLPDGRIWNGLSGLRKDNTGYDLKHLLIGGEGTLGIVTAACLKLYPRPRDVQTAYVAIPSVAAAVELLGRLRAASGDLVTSFEILPRLGIEFATRHIAGTRDPLGQPYPWYVLTELSGGGAMAKSSGAETPLRAALEEALGQAMEDAIALDATVAQSGEQAAQFWRIREGMFEAQLPEGGSIKHDVSVPISKVAAFIATASDAVVNLVPGCRPLPFGHVGDGNIHFNVSQPLPLGDKAATAAFMARWDEMGRVVHDIVHAMGGSISAEHGIGRFKRADLARYEPAVALDAMRAVKRALDPKGIMNPGKVI
ncbi:MAG: FAD-binding oxidoreductase [Alphaproteobacteria bacterium]|nr:FAD-binding oxidoreductase [Alphaproteobacteria bacterium]